MTRSCVIVLLTLLLGGTGCINTKGWSYRPEARRSTEPLANLSVAVPRFEDQRDTTNKNRMLLYMIPLALWGSADYAAPEGGQMFVSSNGPGFDPPHDFARAIASEVDNARIFRETFVTDRVSDGDLVLFGEILATRYQGRIYSYGLSVYGPGLWFFGLPAGKSSNQLELKLSLAETMDSAPLWTHTIRGSAGPTTHYLYSMKPDFQYDELLKRGMADAIASLEKVAPTIQVDPAALSASFSQR